jgi:hypothetical protein
VSWGSVTKINGKEAADVVAKQAARSGQGPGYSQPGKGDGLGADIKAAAEKMVAKHTEGPAATALKGYGWKPSKTDSMGAVTYAHPKMGNTFHVDVDGTLINANSGTEIKPEQAAEYLRGFHANSDKQAEGAAKQKAAEEAAKPKKEGPGSRGSTKWYYAKDGEVVYGDPREGTKPGQGEPPAGDHGAKLGDTITVSIGGGQDAKVTKVYRDGGVQVKLSQGIPGNSGYGPGSTTHPEKDEITHVNGEAVGEHKL